MAYKFGGHSLQALVIAILEELPLIDGIEGHIWRRWMPIAETADPSVLWSIVKSTNNLAAFIGEDGVALPFHDLGRETFEANIHLIGASWHIDQATRRKLNDPGWTAMVNMQNSTTGAGERAKVMRVTSEKTQTAIQMLERQHEYMFNGMLKGQITWPPLDENGDPIAQPMRHWNPNIKVNFTYPDLPPDMTQNATTLQGYEGEPGTNVVWTDTVNANGINDLEVIESFLKRKYGLSMTGGTIITTHDVIRALAKQEKVVSLIRGNQGEQIGANRILHTGDVVDYLDSALKWNIVEYTPMPWTYEIPSSTFGEDPEVKLVDYMDKYDMFFIPNGTQIGNMYTTLVQTGPLSQGGSWAYGTVPWESEGPAPTYYYSGGLIRASWPVAPDRRKIFRFRVNQ